MKKDDSGIYDLSGAQPQVEGSQPDGGGVGSDSAAGGNKRDPVSSSPTVGSTIAGRTVNTGAPGDVSNMGHETVSSTVGGGDTDDELNVGGPDTRGKGVTGIAGSSIASDPEDGVEHAKKGGPPDAVS